LYIDNSRVEDLQDAAYDFSVNYNCACPTICPNQDKKIVGTWKTMFAKVRKCYGMNLDNFDVMEGKKNRGLFKTRQVKKSSRIGNAIKRRGKANHAAIAAEYAEAHTDLYYDNSGHIVFKNDVTTDKSGVVRNNWYKVGGNANTTLKKLPEAPPKQLQASYKLAKVDGIIVDDVVRVVIPQKDWKFRGDSLVTPTQFGYPRVDGTFVSAKVNGQEMLFFKAIGNAKLSGKLFEVYEWDNGNLSISDAPIDGVSGRYITRTAAMEQLLEGPKPNFESKYIPPLFNYISLHAQAEKVADVRLKVKEGGKPSVAMNL
jgi:hypothetical protein